MLSHNLPMLLNLLSASDFSIQMEVSSGKDHRRQCKRTPNRLQPTQQMTGQPEINSIISNRPLDLSIKPTLDRLFDRSETSQQARKSTSNRNCKWTPTSGGSSALDLSSSTKQPTSESELFSSHTWGHDQQVANVVATSTSRPPSSISTHSSLSPLSSLLSATILPDSIWRAPESSTEADSQSKNFPDSMITNISNIQQMISSSGAIDQHQADCNLDRPKPRRGRPKGRRTTFSVPQSKQRDELALKQKTSSTSKRNSHPCKHCGRLFSRSDMLTRHSRLHSGLKPYQCNICLQVFSRSDHLSTHERTHTGEKPYQCDLCPYSACRRDMITRHMRTHSEHRRRSTKSKTSLKINDKEQNQICDQQTNGSIDIQANSGEDKIRYGEPTNAHSEKTDDSNSDIDICVYDSNTSEEDVSTTI